MNQKMSTESWMLKAFEYESFSFIWNMYLQNISDSSKHTAFSFSERLVQRLSLSVDIKLGTCLPLVGNIIKRLAEKSEGFQQNLVKWNINLPDRGTEILFNDMPGKYIDWISERSRVDWQEEVHHNSSYLNHTDSVLYLVEHYELRLTNPILWKLWCPNVRGNNQNLDDDKRYNSIPRTEEWENSLLKLIDNSIESCTLNTLILSVLFKYEQCVIRICAKLIKQSKFISGTELAFKVLNYLIMIKTLSANAHNHLTKMKREYIYCDEETLSSRGLIFYPWMLPVYLDDQFKMYRDNSGMFKASLLDCKRNHNEEGMSSILNVIAKYNQDTLPNDVKSLLSLEDIYTFGYDTYHVCNNNMYDMYDDNGDLRDDDFMAVDSDSDDD